MGELPMRWLYLKKILSPFLDEHNGPVPLSLELIGIHGAPFVTFIDDIIIMINMLDHEDY